MSKSILIISFSMPPSPDIGGRRWVKFAKYLKLNGHTVKIIAAEEDLPGVSPWINDGNELKEDIAFISSSYPKYLGLQPLSVKEKVLYRLSLAYAKISSRGNYYDKSNHWKTRLLRSCSDAITKNGVKNVICTIPPFRMAYFILELKKEFPGVNFIVDYRDPWSTNKSSFGFTGLSEKRFNYEKEIEEKVIRGYDKITAVSTEMGEHFRKVLGEQEFQKKFALLPNGFDRADFNTGNLSAGSAKNAKINIVFAGTFYDKAVPILEKLMQVVAEVEARHPSRKGVLNFIFIGTMPASLNPFFTRYAHSFVFLGKKSLKDTYAIIGESDFCSLFLTDDLNYSFSTKFYEYIALKKPIISFSREKGANARFIEENQLGLGVDFSTMENIISQLMNGGLDKTFAPKIDVDEFNVSRLVNRIEAILAD